MREEYIELMERVLSAYSDEHISSYFEHVKADGLREHGFPRLTANIGILISFGKRRDLLPLFIEMMEFCCRSIPFVKAANDFSVREIVCCIEAIFEAGVVEPEIISNWKAMLSKIDPKRCYNVIADTPKSDVHNWALFTGVSEIYRKSMLGEDINEFIEIQLASQVKWVDKLGMYQDYGKVRNPVLYDLVSRMLFSLALSRGYKGRYFKKINALLKKGGIATLAMLSVSGEIPYGGRSNQFLHNEASVCTILEFEAARYRKAGDLEKAKLFDKARAAAISSLCSYLDEQPISHVKNRYPIDSMIGCEGYAYFDKYMITTASNLYVAYLISDGEDKEPLARPYDLAESAEVFKTTKHFHKVFMRSGEYCAEIDTNADFRYDSSGLGRLHRKGAPSAIAISHPCPEHPKFKIKSTDRMPLAVCPALCVEGELATASYEAHDKILKLSKCGERAIAKIKHRIGERSAVATYELTSEGLSVTAYGESTAILIPAFYFDGKEHAEISAEECSLTVSYRGWKCVWQTNGVIEDLCRTSANRNGIYKAFAARSSGNLVSVKVKIEKL